MVTITLFFRYCRSHSCNLTLASDKFRLLESVGQDVCHDDTSSTKEEASCCRTQTDRSRAGDVHDASGFHAGLQRT